MGYGGSSWLEQKDMLVDSVGGKGAIATNVSVGWFTPLGEKVVIHPIRPVFNET